VEVMFPVEAEDLRRRICEEIIPAYLNDNRRSRILQADGSYVRADAKDGEVVRRSQLDLLTLSAPRPAAPLPTITAATKTAAWDTNGESEPEREKKKRKDKDKEKEKKRTAPR
jgi:hypothetical protein